MDSEVAIANRVTREREFDSSSHSLFLNFLFLFWLASLLLFAANNGAIFNFKVGYLSSYLVSEQISERASKQVSERVDFIYQTKRMILHNLVHCFVCVGSRGDHRIGRERETKGTFKTMATSAAAAATAQVPLPCN